MGFVGLQTRSSTDAAEVKRMKQRLELFNLHEVPVSGDGNCQFSAISHQLFGDFNHSTQLRRISVEWLRKHPNWTPVRFTSLHHMMRTISH